jgi:efflux transporter, outer membrane factor (OMF) lipoprotein, NodT family
MSTYVPLSKQIQSHHRSLLGMCMAMIVAGCSLVPTYQRPSLPVPRSQESTALEVKVGEDMPELSRDEQALITELSPNGELRSLVGLALSYNRDLRLAGLRVKEARAAHGVSRADRLPTVGAGVERDRQHFDNAAAEERYGQDITLATLGFSDFEPDFFGRLRSLSEAARHDYLATTYGQQATRSALVAEVARTYLSQRLTTALKADAQRIDDAQQDTLHLIEEQQRLGAVSVDDVAVQRVAAERAHQQLAVAIANDSSASQALLLLTGYAAALPPFDPEVASAYHDRAAGLADMPSERLLERFDVRQSEESLKAANANIGAARAAFFPSIKLSTGAGLQSDSLRTLFSEGNGTWLFSPQLNVPLFDGGRSRSNLNLAKVRKQMAVAQYEKTIQVAFREMADVLIQRRLVLEQMRGENELRNLAEDKARRALIAYAHGGADRTTVLASTISVNQADIAWRQLRHDLLMNRLNLYRALCGADATPSQRLSENGVFL